MFLNSTGKRDYRTAFGDQALREDIERHIQLFDMDIAWRNADGMRKTLEVLSFTVSPAEMIPPRLLPGATTLLESPDLSYAQIEEAIQDDPMAYLELGSRFRFNTSLQYRIAYVALNLLPPNMKIPIILHALCPHRAEWKITTSLSENRTAYINQLIDMAPTAQSIPLLFDLLIGKPLLEVSKAAPLTAYIWGRKLELSKAENTLLFLEASKQIQSAENLSLLLQSSIGYIEPELLEPLEKKITELCEKEN